MRRIKTLIHVSKNQNIDVINFALKNNNSVAVNMLVKNFEDNINKRDKDGKKFFFDACI